METPALLALALGLSACGAIASAQPHAAAGAGVPYPLAPRTQPPYATGLRTIRIVEHRQLRLPDGRQVPRTLVTLVRYPIAGPATRTDVAGAPALPGPFPLIVFGHGFAVTPAPYAALLQAWARAGFIVAAPVFPLENANAPGGPDENDIINQPGDMSAVITRLIGAGRSKSGPFSGRVNERAVAVAGQSDGGETALAVTYDRYYLDRRVRAAVILSGARLGPTGFAFPAGSPPLLATQGTADVVNLPKYTYQFFDQASAPKFLLQLLGAPHLPPYTTEQPQLGIVARTTTAFLDYYLYGWPRALGRLERYGRVAGISALTAVP